MPALAMLKNHERPFSDKVKCSTVYLIFIFHKLFKATR